MQFCAGFVLCRSSVCKHLPHVCRLTRGNQVFVFPIHLSEYVSPSPTFYGTVVPLAAYFAIKLLIVKPYVDKQQERFDRMLWYNSLTQKSHVPRYWRLHTFVVQKNGQKTPFNFIHLHILDCDMHTSFKWPLGQFWFPIVAKFKESYSFQ